MTYTISHDLAGRCPCACCRPFAEGGHRHRSIVTIRDDEFRAVLAAFPDKVGNLEGARRVYTLRQADAGGGERHRIAVLRLIEQGQGEAQDATRDLIDDLGPQLVVGIAGGRPSDDVKLGDVVVPTRIHDFTVEARQSGEPRTYAVTGGPSTRRWLPWCQPRDSRGRLGDWTAGLPPQPPVGWAKKGQLYGPPDWQRALRDTLEHHHSRQVTPRAPVYVAGPITSSDRLVKDPDLLIPWLQTARDLLAIEMESGGVYRAVRGPVSDAGDRGISDIVGLKRADAWTRYACASAAAFTRAFLRTRPIALLRRARRRGAAACHPHDRPAPARQDRHAGSAPAEERRLTSDQLLARPSKLLPSQFEQVLYRAQIPHEHLSGPTAPPGLRAVEVMRYVEQQNQLDRVAGIVEQVMQSGGRQAGPGPR